MIRRNSTWFTLKNENQASDKIRFHLRVNLYDYGLDVEVEFLSQR